MHLSHYLWALNELDLSLTQEQANHAFKHWISVAICFIAWDKLVFCIQCGNCNTTEKNLSMVTSLKYQTKKWTLQPWSRASYISSTHYFAEVSLNQYQSAELFYPFLFYAGKTQYGWINVAYILNICTYFFLCKPKNKFPHCEEIYW